MAACGAKCTDKDKANTTQGIYQTGRLFHILYATANDKRYYQPAHDLYAMAIPLLPPVSTTNRPCSILSWGGLTRSSIMPA